MIISRYLTKEIVNTLLAVTFVLLLIFLSKELVRYLGYAASGKLGANILLQLMGFEIPYLLAFLLPLGLYLGIVLAYGRLYAESEMRVLHACGLSIGKLVSITSKVIWIVAGIVVILMLWVNPWIAAEKDSLIQRSISINNIINTLMPGRFQVSNEGKRVVYVEDVSRSRKLATNLFIADQSAHQELGSHAIPLTVVSAEQGTQLSDPVSKEQYMVALNGYRYEGVPGQNDFKIIQFKKYAVRMPHSIIEVKHQEQESISTAALWKDYQKPENAAELQWRFSIPLSVILLGWLAIPFSQVSPRRGRYSQLFPAILMYIVYINLLFVARNWVEQKFIPISMGMWWVHFIALFTAGIFLMVQSGWSVKRLLGRSR